METIHKAVLIGHTVIALLIIILVLLQRGKGADAGAAFGAGASGTVFGARGSGSFFSRATAVCATLFFASSLTLAYLSSQRPSAPSSLLEDAAIETEELPDPGSNLPLYGLPPLEAADDSLEMPAIDESVADDQD